MGTRHFIGVVLDGDFKIAQYGQWDGYPSGQGRDVLRFADDADLLTFAEKCRELHWITQPEINAVNATEGWANEFPWLSRDAGAGILDMVLDGMVPSVQNSEEFPLDSLFCEWAYVLDLDALQLEVYEGFQKVPPTAGRWAGKKDPKSDYYPVNLVKTYSLTDLPTEAEFLAELEPNEEEDED